MASSTLHSTAAFEERAKAFGVEAAALTKFKDKNLNTFGRFAFSIAHNPQVQNDRPFVDFGNGVAEVELAQDQLAALRRLFFESHAFALADVRSRVESSPDPTAASRKLPAAERLARQTAQQGRLGGLIFNPDTIPANQLVDAFVEMLELNTLSYIKPEQCTSRAQEVSAVKKDPTIATDSQCSPGELAEDADRSASELLDLLGWKHARTGPKGRPFEPCFQVLGCTLNLERAAAGEIGKQAR